MVNRLSLSNEKTVLYRINVGGEKITATDKAIDWSADTRDNPSEYRISSVGGTNIYRKSHAINLSDLSASNGVPEQVFRSERWDSLTGQNMEWKFDVGSGEYEVRLYLAEIYKPIDTVGERVFDVAVEGSVPQVFDDIDIFSSVGQNSGFMLSHTTMVTDGSLSLEFVHETQNPAVKGIEILAVN